jgi:hypothetical protein
MMIFKHVNYIFSQIFISLFQGLFNDKTALRVLGFGGVHDNLVLSPIT